MKKFTVILTVLIAMTINANAQIPNNGFENWPLSTNGWPVGNPIQSTDVYPIGVGNFSLKIQNNAIPNPPYNAFGFCVTFPTPGSWLPSFPITGHPNSFTGYLKFIPINGDTAVVSAILYLNGNPVSTATQRFYNATSSWISFNVPFPSYFSADSASIAFSAYNWVFGQSGMPTMQGNSELYIDNLNFDNLISSISDQPSVNNFFDLYPNPASDIISIDFNNVKNDNFTFSIYNVFGSLIKTEILNENQQQISINDLSDGVYIVEVKSADVTSNKKIIIQR